MHAGAGEVNRKSAGKWGGTKTSVSRQRRDISIAWASVTDTKHDKRISCGRFALDNNMETACGLRPNESLTPNPITCLIFCNSAQSYVAKGVLVMRLKLSFLDNARRTNLLGRNLKDIERVRDVHVIAHNRCNLHQGRIFVL